MKNTQSIHSILAWIILLFLFISLLNQMIFAESKSTADNGMQKGMMSSPAASPEPPMIKGRCENTRIECSSLCQTDLSAETRAKELEEYSRKTRIDADKVAQRAASIEKQANKKLRKMGLSVDTGGSGAVNPNAKSAWKIVEIAPRLFVSNEARSRADKENKEAKKYGTNPPPNLASQEASELLVKLQMASKTAEEAQKVADEAKREADQARAYADSVRQSYKSCLNGK